MINNQLINNVVRKIVNNFHPERIILFGSYANDTHKEDSDLDLIVIWNTDLNVHKRKLLLSKLFPMRNFSLDIFAYTEKEEQKFKNIPGTILYEAIHNGKIIYG